MRSCEGRRPVIDCNYKKRLVPNNLTWYFARMEQAYLFLYRNYITGSKNQEFVGLAS